MLTCHHVVFGCDFNPLESYQHYRVSLMVCLQNVSHYALSLCSLFVEEEFVENVSYKRRFSRH